MKKINKILSSALAATMLVSCMAINVFAAESKAHTLTITTDKDNYVAGENVALTITVDNTADLASLSYLLRVDQKGLTVETAKVSKLEKFIDKTWLDDMKKDENSVGDYWKYYMGEPQISYAEAGTIKCGWAGGANGGMGNEDPENEVKDNRVIGKFYVKINDDAADGTYTIALDDSIGTCYTTDAGQGMTPTLLTGNTVTVKVGEDAEPQSFNAKVPYGAKAQAATGIKFNLTTNDVTKNVKTVDYKVPFFKTEDDKSKIENIGNIAVGLTINGVPSGVTVTANSAELYLD